jgi:hypothetical protein
MYNVMTIRPGEVQLFHPDGRTDVTKLTVAFRNCAKATHKFREPDCPFLSNVTVSNDLAIESCHASPLTTRPVLYVLLNGSFRYFCSTC